MISTKATASLGNNLLILKQLLGLSLAETNFEIVNQKHSPICLKSRSINRDFLELYLGSHQIRFRYSIDSNQRVSLQYPVKLNHQAIARFESADVLLQILNREIIVPSIVRYQEGAIRVSRSSEQSKAACRQNSRVSLGKPNTRKSDGILQLFWRKIRAILEDNPNFAGIDFSHLDFNSQDFSERNFSGANLSQANLFLVNFANSNLTGTDLTGADLTDADLTNADLTNANLTGTDLTNANLTDADLTNADLTNADLTNANLTDANLTNADLTNANLTEIRGFDPQTPQRLKAGKTPATSNPL